MCKIKWLACAPSNVAVDALAKSFHEKFPAYAAIRFHGGQDEFFELENTFDMNGRPVHKIKKTNVEKAEIGSERSKFTSQ